LLRQSAESEISFSVIRSLIAAIAKDAIINRDILSDAELFERTKGLLIGVEGLKR
jgi:hypothetical protein